jgi:hypothetical protein
MLTNEAQAAARPAERLTWDEICRRYPNEWVVLAEFDRPGDEMDLEFNTAMVIAHKKRRKEASADVKEAFKHYVEVGSFWTGEIVVPSPRFILP